MVSLRFKDVRDFKEADQLARPGFRLGLLAALLVGDGFRHGSTDFASVYHDARISCHLLTNC